MELNKQLFEKKIKKFVSKYDGEVSCVFYDQELEITSINPNAFESLSHLNRLEITQNHLTKITKDVFSRLSSLKKLDLSYNQIDSIEPNAFKACFRLSSLNLSGNNLKAIDATIFADCWKLETLDLSINQIESIDKDAFKNCLRLTELDLSVNFLNSESLVPGLFGHAKSLIRLCLHSNKIEEIKFSSNGQGPFSNLWVLKTLELQSNYLKDIPPKALEDCKALEELRLDCNNISQFSSIFLCNQSSLIQLDLSENWIKEIDVGFFKDCKKLAILKLNKNKLQSLKRDQFSNLANLETLELTNNEITTIDDNAFKGCRQLYSLKLSGNKLQKDKLGFLASLKNLYYLELSCKDQDDLPQLRPSDDESGDFFGEKREWNDNQARAWKSEISPQDRNPRNSRSVTITTKQSSTKKGPGGH